VVGVIVLALNWHGPWLAPFGMAMAAWLVFGALAEISNRIALFRVPVMTSLRRLIGLPGSAIGMSLGHAGLGVMIAGMVGVTAWRTEVITTMRPGDTQTVAGYSVKFLGEDNITGPNYTGTAGRFEVSRNGQLVDTLASEKRNFRPSGMPTTKVALRKTPAGDLYMVLGDTAADGSRAIRMYFNPLIDFLWLGGVFMFLGGVFSISDRRYRIGAPKRAAKVETVAAE
jgi:cytochrome c-type biogenesis protein CcmF